MELQQRCAYLFSYFTQHTCSCVIFPFLCIRWEEGGREWGLKYQRSRGLACCTRCLVKGYVLPSRPLWEKKNPTFCVKPSYCLQVGACTKNGKGRTEMSEKCQMPAGSVQSISPTEMFTPGKRVPARVTVVVQGQTCWWLSTQQAPTCYERIKEK